jgi:signal transduction histidine kinase
MITDTTEPDDVYARFFRMALAIGGSHDLKVMLGQSMQAIMAGLNLSGSAVLFFSPDAAHPGIYRPIYERPGGTHRTVAYRHALDIMKLHSPDTDIGELMGMLPLFRQAPDGNWFSAHLMPHIGVIILISDMAIPDSLHEHLNALAIKLAAACSACLQEIELEMVSAGTRHINEELKQSQDSLTTNRNHLAMILQSLGEGVIVLSADMRITLMNVKAMELLHCIPGSESATELDSLFALCTEHPKELILFISSASDEGWIDLRIEDGRNPARDVRLTKNTTDGIYENAPATILLLRDVTAEKQAERLKNEFIANLSHELRTPMNAILGISQVLKDRHAENLTGQQKEGLDIIHASGERLLALINDLLDLSKIEAGRMELDTAPFHLHTMIAALRAATEPLLRGRDLSLSMTIEPGTPDFVVGDRLRIMQILTNLLSNAVKFTEQGTISLSCSTRESAIIFSCQDSGAGIREEDLQTVFERFRQIDGSSSRRHSGTGLGLSLSQDLAHLMGGNISVQSTFGEGSVFTLRLPLQAVEKMDLPNPSESAGEQPIPPTGLKILVVDDEEDGRSTMRIMLGAHCVLRFADSGSSALTVLNEFTPDIILMDIMMPGLPGTELLQQIRAQGVITPVIAVTALAMEHERRYILEHGFNAYIAKPFTESTLFITMQRVHPTTTQ